MMFKATKTKLRKDHDRAIRTELRKRRKAVAERIKEVRKRKRVSLSKVREQCRRSFARLRDRAKQIRAEHREAANREIEPLRRAAVQACRGSRDKVSRFAAKQLSRLSSEERQARADEFHERSTQGLLKRKDRRGARAERESETDDEVRNNLDPDLVPVWDAMREGFRRTPPRKTRTEHFLEWVHDNAEAVAALQTELQDEATDNLIRQHEAEQRAIQEELDRTSFNVEDFERLNIEAPLSSVSTEFAKAARKAPRPKRVNKKMNDVELLKAAVMDFGDLKEPEAAAHLGWTEARAWKASKAGLKVGAFERSAVNGALYVPGEPGKQKRLSDARVALQVAEKQTGAKPVRLRPEPPKSETYQQATKRLLGELPALGWTVHQHDRFLKPLKTPYVEGHDRRVYFKPQALWGTLAGNPLVMARSLDLDRRRLSAEEFSRRVAPGYASKSREGAPANAGKALVLQAFEDLDARSGGRYYVSLRDLRAQVPQLSREHFDRALNDLRRDWVLTLSPAEGRHEVVPQDILNAGVLEQGRLLVYVTRREPS